MANGLIKRGGYWHFDFWFQKTRYQGSTHLKNLEKAKSFISKLRSDLALGLVGLTHREAIPTLKAFLEGQFLSSVQQHARAENTRSTYERAIRRLCEYPPFATLRLDKVNKIATEGYGNFRLGKKASVNTINSELRTLRKAMIFADSCELIRYRKFPTLPGQKARDFIVSGELENEYLALAEYPLKQVAILMLDLGLRPEEAVSLAKANITDDTVTIPKGKTPNAKRCLPQTARTREALELCSALFPDSPWIFPGYKGKHLRRARIDALHFILRQTHKLPDEFDIYCCRHTFGTRLAQSGANPFEIKTAMGHAAIRESERYIHPDSSTVTLAMKRKEVLDKILRGEEVPAEVTTETLRKA